MGHSKIETLYYEWADEMENSEGVKAAEQKVEDLIKHSGLCREAGNILEDATCEYAEATQKQGFLAGFRTAIELIFEGGGTEHPPGNKSLSVSSQRAGEGAFL